MSRAVVVVDAQKDFVEGGSLAVNGGQKMVDRLVHILSTDDVNTLFYTKDWHIDPGNHFSDNPDFIDSWPVHCVAETPGADFAADFKHFEDNVFMKGQYQASYSGVDGLNKKGASLVDALRSHGVHLVVVVGIAFDYCVKATALDLKGAGFDVVVDSTFTAAVHPENNPATIADLEAAGIVVV